MAQGPSQGMNLGGKPSPYADSFVALNLMVGVEPWRYWSETHEGFVPQNRLHLDPRGWLTELPVIDGISRGVYANVLYGQVLPAGQFILEWKGEGEIDINHPYRRIGDHRFLVDFQPDYTDAQGHGQDDGFTLLINSTDPHHTGNYIRDIKLFRAQDADLVHAGELFNPLWMDRVDDFRILRTHDWQETNFPSSVNWTRGAYAADQARWGGEGRGMPYELLVNMANEARADLWINIPHTASAAFIRQAALFVKSHLDPALRLHVEFSNEFWTTGFDQHDYFVNGGLAAFGDARFATAQFYGSRAAAMADIFTTVFGAGADRLRPVLTVDDDMFRTGEAAQMLRSPDVVAAGGTATFRHGFDVLATDGYLGWYAPDPNMAALIHDWMTDADGGFGRARDYLLHELQTQLLPNWQAGRALADQYHLQFMVYEGGALLLNDGPNPDAAITDFAMRFSRSAELREVYEAELAAWRMVGSGPFAWYADVGRPGDWGDYGHWKGIEFLPDPRTDALVTANHETPAWWAGDNRPDSFFANGRYAAGSAGSDRMLGTDLADRLYGLGGSDTLKGGGAEDRLAGGAGQDDIRGGAGADRMNGNGGADRIAGGGGADVLTGGAGADQFLFARGAGAADRITDFVSGQDRLLLDAASFGGHAPGPLRAAEFAVFNQTIAETARTRVFFLQQDHSLYFDPDGSGAESASRIATLNGATIAAGDIWFV